MSYFELFWVLSPAQSHLRTKIAAYYDKIKTRIVKNVRFILKSNHPQILLSTEVFFGSAVDEALTHLKLQPKPEVKLIL